MKTASLITTLTLSLLACGDDDASKALRRGDDNTPSPAATTMASPQSPPPPVCPADVPVAVSLTTQTDVTDIRIVGNNVFYQAGNRIMRVAINLAAPATQLYESPDLVRGWAADDASTPAPTSKIKSLLVIHQDGDLNAELHQAFADGTAPPIKDPNDPLGVIEPTAVTTDWHASGTRIFGSDAKFFYVLADTAGGEGIFSVSRTTQTEITEIVAPIASSVISDPQVSANAIWFVRDGGSVQRVGLGTTPPDPNADANGDGIPDGVLPEDPAINTAREVFGLGIGCNLAVGATHAFCASTNTIESRDLTGGSARTLFALQTSAYRATFGDPMIASADTIVVRSDQASTKDVQKHVIRAIHIGTASERLLACGRDVITTMATSATHVAWVEQGKGLFVVPL